MQNFKLPPGLQTFPAGVQSFPGVLNRVNPRWRLILGLLAALLAIGLVWWIVASLSGSEGRRPPPPPVIVGTAQVQNVTVQERTIGTVLANTSVQVTSQVQGQLLSAGFHEGQIVHEGDILFQIDPKPFQAALEQAKAALSRDQATLVANQHDAQRYSSLAKQGAASAQQRDQAIAAAKAMVATVAADKAAVDLAQMNLGYTTIRAPVTGKTGPILIQPGNLVKSNDNTNPIVTLNQVQPVKVSFSLPQADLPRIQDQIQKGQLIATVSAHGDGRVIDRAKIDFLGNAVNPATGTVELRATFNNADFRLVPGEMVDVSAALNTLEHTIVVPREAVNTGQDGRYVWVVTADGKAAMRPITVLYDNGKINAIRGNVKAGDRVITDGQLRVTPGIAVSIRQPGAKSAK